MHAPRLPRRTDTHRRTLRVPRRKERTTEAVLFCDVGGVLVHHDGPELRRGWAARFGCTRRTFEERVWSRISSSSFLSLEEAAVDIAGDFAVDLPTAERLLLDFHAHWRLDRDALDAVVALRDRSRLAILSNAGPAARFALCTLLGLDEMFDPILISCELGVEKPDERSYALAAQAASVRPERCVLLDDDPANVDAARECGWQGVLRSADGVQPGPLASAVGRAQRSG